MAVDIILIIKEAAPKLLLAVGKWGIGKLLETTPLSRALESTVMAFPHIEDLHNTLNTWFKSDSFSRLTSELQMGSRAFVLNDVIYDLKTSTGFYLGDDTDAEIARFITAFFINYQNELYATSQGLQLVANRHEVLFEDIKSEIAEGKSSVNSLISTIYKLDKLRLPLADDHNKREASEDIYDAKVTTAKTLLDEGKPKAAQSILKALRQEVKDKHPSKHLLFRIETNLGACALELDNLEDAKHHLAIALEFNPNNPKALSNAAVAKLIDKQFTEAMGLATRARELTSKDSHATSIYLESLHRLQRYEELEQLLVSESWILDDLSCQLVLAQIRLNQERFSDAHALAKSSVILDQDNVVGYLLIAESLIKPIRKALAHQQTLRWRVKPETLLLLKDAEKALSCAISLLAEKDNSSKSIEAFMNRAIVRGMLGDFDRAIHDCDRVLVIDSTLLVAIHNKGLLLLDKGNASEAIIYLKQSHAQDNRSINKALALANAYTNEGLSAETIDLLEPYWRSIEYQADQVNIANFLLNAYTDLNLKEQITNLTQILTTDFVNDPYAISVLARQKRRENNLAEAIELLKKAQECPNSNKELIGMELADLHYSLKDFSQAANYYSSIVNQDSNNPQLQKYLISLFNTGKLREALNVACLLRAGGTALPMISEIEARIHAYVGAYDVARTLYWQLSKIEPHKTSHLIDVAMLDIRKGTPQNCLDIVNHIKVETLDAEDAYVLMRLAYIRFQLGLLEVLPLAYRARRLAFNDPDIHLAYMEVCLKCGEKGNHIPKPTIVEIGCTVHLRDETTIKQFTIVDDNITNIEIGEIPASDALAKAMMGKSIGDTIVLKQGIEDLSYVISDIKSKFVHAFHQTLAEFTTWFPDNTQFCRIKINDKDNSKLRLMLDRRHEWVSQAMQFYENEQLTLGAFAEVIKKGLITVWIGMVSRADGRIHSSTGTTEETSKEGMLLSQCQSIVLELTSLLTLNHLNLLDRLALRFSKVFISRSVVDDLSKAIQETHEIKPSGTIWKEHGQYWRSETDPDSLAREEDFLKRILDYINSSTEIISTTSALEMGKDKFEQISKLIGKSSLSSILVAKELNVPVYSDQLGLRQIAKNDWGVEGVWTQSVLVSMNDLSIVTQEEYAAAVKKLALSNYHFVSINAQILIGILKSNGMELNQETVHLFSLLHGPTCSEESCVSVAADLVKLIWLEPMPEQNKFLIFDLIRSCLVTGREGHKIIPRFKAALNERFFLLPYQLKTIQGSMNLW